ncbi:MAG: hypothetical protein LBC48_01720 [Dysgonamonadaceae bacterium]|nr:hypothetical protein [Dysgonamonadaceae bacterium]
MANCIQLYQALSHAVSVGFTNKGKYQSVYNAFTSKNVPVMSMVRYDTLDGIIVNATGLITVSTGNLGTPVVKYADVYMDINFAHFRERLAVGDKVRLFGLDLSGYVVLMQEYGLTRGDLDLGSLHLEFVDSMPSQQFKCGAIMYKENGGGSTNAALLDWGNAAINA